MAATEDFFQRRPPPRDIGDAVHHEVSQVAAPIDTLGECGHACLGLFAAHHRMGSATKRGVDTLESGRVERFDPNHHPVRLNTPRLQERHKAIRAVAGVRAQPGLMPADHALDALARATASDAVPTTDPTRTAKPAEPARALEGLSALPHCAPTPTRLRHFGIDMLSWNRTFGLDIGTLSLLGRSGYELKSSRLEAAETGLQ